MAGRLVKPLPSNADGTTRGLHGLSPEEKAAKLRYAMHHVRFVSEPIYIIV